MGLYGDIYLSTFNELGDNWIKISNYKGNNLVHSDDFKYIYISTNNGILINNNNSNDIILDNEGCNDKCSDNYNNYNGIYKFNELLDYNIKNKNILAIGCTPYGNILIIQIKDGPLIVAKIKKKGNENENKDVIWNNEYKIPDKNLETEYDKNGNILWNFYMLNKKNYNFNSIIILEENIKDNAKIILGNNNSIYYISYNKNKLNIFENEIKLSEYIYTNSNIDDLFKNNINISNLLMYNISYNKNIYFIINKNIIYNTNNKIYKKIELDKSELNLINKNNKNYKLNIKKFVINKNGSQAIIISNIGHLYINKNMNEFYNNKSNFERLLINLN
jgi:hypothetical protein